MIPSFAASLGGRRPQAGSNNRLLQGVANAAQSANFELCLDAGALASYAGSGLWLDQSGQGNDFRLGSTTGADTTDPTFHGVAGAGSVNEYFSFDGGDYVEIASGVNPAFITNMHKAGGAFGLAEILYAPTGTTSLVLLSDENGVGGVGIDLDFQSTQFRMIVLNGAGFVFTTAVNGILPLDAWFSLQLSVAVGVPNGLILSINGAAVAVSTASYTSPSAGAATYPVRVGARGGGTAFTDNGVRCAAVGGWSRAPSAADHAALHAQIKTGFGLP